MRRGHSYYNLYFHLTWHTKSNYPYLTEEIWKFLAIHVKIVSEKHGARVLALNGTEDHAHLLLQCRKWPDMPGIMWAIKGKSSYDISKHQIQNLYWQAGYTVFSVSEEKVGTLTKYIENQKEHHHNQ
jgi:putative transposase